jgi:phosphonate transport system substrate-binding protein
MARPALRAITFLAPNMFPVYQFTLQYLSQQLGCVIELAAGSHYEELYQADLTFVCGLPYVLYTSPRRTPAPIEALVAPVLQGERFQHRPIYFSDVIVHRDSPVQSFADLRGCSWAYNEPLSQSGYGITRYTLVSRGETNGYFGKVVEAGFHQKAIEMVVAREVDASAIDAQVLLVELRNQPRLANSLRIVDSLGASTIQPVAVATNLPDTLKRDIQAVFVGLHTDPIARTQLDRGFIEHFTHVCDSDYDDIRAMLAACERANFLILR